MKEEKYLIYLFIYLYFGFIIDDNIFIYINKL